MPRTVPPLIAAGYQNEIEERLAEIWCGVLRVPRVGRDDNFFALGGDSILSIQIVARARAAGWAITPTQVFQHQTVAELARVARPVDASAGGWAPVTGPVPLTPVQRWWLEDEPVDTHHFNQAVLLQVARPLARDAVEKLLAALDAHHDALRSRLRKTAAGDWECAIEPPGRAVPLRWIELAGVGEAGATARIAAACAEEQARLAPADAVMWRAAYFDLGAARPGRLFVAVHHFAVDGVSWRILHEDLERGAAQLARGESVALPAKTTSFKAWAERLAAEGARGLSAAEGEFWTKAAGAGASVRLPKDFAAPDNVNIEANADAVEVGLDATETGRLLQELPARTGASVEAALLACAVEAIGAWTGGADVAVAMEGHGREEIFADVDLSRTVGWFTAIYPLRVARPATPAAVAARLRAVPRRGVGYGIARYLAAHGDGLAAAAEPEVSFNYLGRFDAGGDAGAIFSGANEDRGAFVSPRARRHHVLEINGNVTGGELRVAWRFSRALHRRETIEGVAGKFIGRLRALLAAPATPAPAAPASDRDEAIAEVEFS